MTKILGTILGFLMAAVVFGSAVGLVVAFPIKWCWNATMPGIFSLREISWGEAWCLYFLAVCLLKSSLTCKHKE